MRYVAFLRGINVGGNKLIKMDELAKVFTAARFQNVRTYIQSGNVVFDSQDSDVDQLAKKIERRLVKAFDYEIPVAVVPLETLAAIVKRSPFKNVEGESDIMLCVVFFVSDPPKLKLPIKSATENAEIVAMKGRTAFVVCRRKKTGWFGYPSNVVEKQFGVAATTRQWKTLEKMVAFARDA